MSIGHLRIHFIAGCVDHPGHVGGGFVGKDGQLSHLKGHHGKTASGTACACSLDFGVQGQEIGLLGDRGDDFNQRRQRVYLAGQPLDALEVAFELLGLHLHLHCDGGHDLLVVFGPLMGALR
jgi:hypothetical protein